MSLSNYAQACRRLAEELRQSLTADDIKALHGDLQSLGLEEWGLWTAKNEQECADYLESTPSQRSRRKAWQDPALRRRLIYQASCMADDSAAVIAVLADSYALLPAPQVSYRSMAALAWEWPFQIDEALPKADPWPFRGYRNPFLND